MVTACTNRADMVKTSATRHSHPFPRNTTCKMVRSSLLERGNLCRSCPAEDSPSQSLCSWSFPDWCGVGNVSLVVSLHFLELFGLFYMLSMCHLHHEATRRLREYHTSCNIEILRGEKTGRLK